MSPIIERLKTELISLTPIERAELAQFLIQTLDPEGDDDIEAAWGVELARRVEEIKSGVAKGKPAEQVFAEIRARFS